MPTYITGLLVVLLVVLLVGFIIFGGVKRIANVAQVIVPIMALGYILLSIVIVIMNINELPGVFKLS